MSPSASTAQSHSSGEVSQPGRFATHKLRNVHNANNSRFLLETVVTTRVGEGVTKDFYIHKDLLCVRSPFFKVAFTGDRRESRSNLLLLPHGTSEVFTCYREFIYNSPLESLRGSGELLLLQEACNFGSKILDHEFCDMIVDMTVSHANRLSLRPTRIWHEWL
jgi:hypothetical protein